MRKFAYKHRTDRQTSGSKTETTLILSGYSREVANMYMLSNITNRLEKLISEEIFYRRPVLHMPPAYEIKNICCQNKGM